jgi:hypothetical protein
LHCFSLLDALSSLSLRSHQLRLTLCRIFCVWITSTFLPLQVLPLQPNLLELLFQLLLLTLLGLLLFRDFFVDFHHPLFASFFLEPFFVGKLGLLFGTSFVCLVGGDVAAFG